MTDAVQQLNSDPEPGQRRRYRPISPHWPHETPNAKHYKTDVENEKAALKILRDEAAQKARRWQDLVQTADVFLYGMSGLRDHKR